MKLIDEYIVSDKPRGRVWLEQGSPMDGCEFENNYLAEL